ncbi:hypothetical protein PR202_gb00554 [Eleusine coracana subsp. coracana]|uniref:AMP-dependent synthetase/ligase domain-containing protein n=1 Tax=Eleusine coracana subsp. coracana TaxID=191504 RepID=A0AAV5DU12_ELECO|nr:hypothetical protein PR202_gb00554 [Eleusine coracana subsp. coracana]
MAREHRQSPMDAAQRRLRAVSAHIHPPARARGRAADLTANPTAGEYAHVQGYSAVLPEKCKLENGMCTGRYAVETYRDSRYLGSRIGANGTVGDYKWITYGEASTSRTAIGSGLIYHGITEVNLVNRPEWIVDHACAAYSYISVPLYDTLGPDAVQFIVNHATVEAIFCVPQTLSTLLNFITQMPCVRLVVVIGGEDANMPSSLATTGPEVGAILSHENLIANVAGSSMDIKFYPSDVYISYLPLAHIYERSLQVALLHYGVAVGFYQGDNLKLMDDLAALRPTVFASVPRLYNKIYAAITNAVKESGGLKEKLFNTAYNAKKQVVINGKNPSKMWDRLVFSKIQARLGGRVRLMTSGASPLSPDVMEFLRICFSCEVLEGYGMTETSCVVSMMNVGDKLIGHVGSPNPSCGDSFNSSLVAIVAVEPQVLEAWAASEGIQYEDLKQLCADPRAKAAVLADMNSIGKEAQLRGFEFAKVVTLVAEPFTLENGLLTPTFKVKRPQARAYFAKEISDMYAQLQEAESPRQKL